MDIRAKFKMTALSALFAALPFFGKAQGNEVASTDNTPIAATDAYNHAAADIAPYTTDPDTEFKTVHDEHHRLGDKYSYRVRTTPHPDCAKYGVKLIYVDGTGAARLYSGDKKEFVLYLRIPEGKLHPRTGKLLTPEEYIKPIMEQIFNGEHRIPITFAIGKPVGNPNPFIDIYIHGRMHNRNGIYGDHYTAGQLDDARTRLVNAYYETEGMSRRVSETVSPSPN